MPGWLLIPLTFRCSLGRIHVRVIRVLRLMEETYGGGAIRAVQWKSCSRGHVYLGEECPCEHTNRRYRPRIRQSPSEGSRIRRLMPRPAAARGRIRTLAERPGSDVR